MNQQRFKYGNRPLALGETISNDTFVTGLNNNDLIIGNSGCGKTGSYVVPALQNIEGSLVVADTKGQLEKRFKKSLREKGYRVFTLDFVNPERSCGYNPLRYIRRDAKGRIREQDVITVATLLSPVQDLHEPVWDQCARGMLSFLIAYCMETTKGNHPCMEDVVKLHEMFSKQDGDLPFLRWIDANPDSYVARKFHQLQANRTADKMWASVEGFVANNIEPFTFRESKYIFSKESNLDLRSLGKRKTVVFLNVSDTDRSYDQIINLFYAQTMQVLCAEADKEENGRLNIPVRLILDDFAANAVIPDFDKIISIVRSRDIYVSLILQSLSQLESMYSPPVACTIVNNCDHILFMGSQDVRTAEIISARACVTPENILMMPRNKMYLLRSGEKARLVNKIPPYSTLIPDEKSVNEMSQAELQPSA